MATQSEGARKNLFVNWSWWPARGSVVNYHSAYWVQAEMKFYRAEVVDTHAWVANYLMQKKALQKITMFSQLVNSSLKICYQFLKEFANDKLEFAFQFSCFWGLPLLHPFFHGHTKLEVTSIQKEIPLGLIVGIKGKQMSGGKGYSGNQICWKELTYCTAMQLDWL